MLKYKNIIWDFNGTLLNDVDICIEAMNSMMWKRDIPKLTTDIYKEKFTFPVKDYYEAIGFDFTKELFEIPALEFIENYKELMPNAFLFPEVTDILSDFQDNGINQFVLSAMNESFLTKFLSDLNISHFFKSIAGINNHYADGKVNRGIELMKRTNTNSKTTLLIGDTLHDAEVAEQLRVSCILVSKGHQSEKRLKINGNIVVNSLAAAKKIILSNKL